jgi:hypothetical protein
MATRGINFVEKVIVSKFEVNSDIELKAPAR